MTSCWDLGWVHSARVAASENPPQNPAAAELRHSRTAGPIAGAIVRTGYCSDTDKIHSTCKGDVQSTPEEGRKKGTAPFPRPAHEKVTAAFP